jgi:hypothetical protein
MIRAAIGADVLLRGMRNTPQQTRHTQRAH